MATARLDRPSIMVYGGTIRPGVSKLTGEPLDIVSAFQSFGAFSNDKMTEEERFDTVRVDPQLRCSQQQLVAFSFDLCKNNSIL